MENKDILYDHYKDTFEQQKVYLAKRDRLTVLLMVVTVLLVGLIYNPNEIYDKLNTIINAQVDKLTFNCQAINTGLTITFFWFSLQYYMVVLQIEKMYKYIDVCERKLTAAFSDFDINREGAYYLKSYPWMKEFADKVFVLGIPLGFIVLAIWKIVNEWFLDTNLKYVDIVFSTLTIIISLLYVSNRLFHEEFFDKKNYPSLKMKERINRYFKGADEI